MFRLSGRFELSRVRVTEGKKCSTRRKSIFVRVSKGSSYRESTVSIEKSGELIRVLGEGNEGVRLSVSEKLFLTKIEV